MIYIELINIHMAEELLQFESENRDFFARIMGDFGDEYYRLDAMQKLLKDIEESIFRIFAICMLFEMKSTKLWDE